MRPIIHIENLGKQYTIGAKAEPYSTLRESLVKAVRKPIDRFRRNGTRVADSQFWALKDVSFDVMPGEVVGIIGRNGAGKSTLLKILSRITEPTTGRVELYGRVGSLLEVGTGFHPELTGRENIYLNGAILGMRRDEIARKFDEIVDFAEIEEFLDTPVKRYSSGMYMRLAFAVAANLEPEVLVVDEVLAVGDAEFQKKCLGKMKDVSEHGRTVLFVSHNMAAVKSICRRAIQVEKGKIVCEGNSEEVVDHYLRGDNNLSTTRSWLEPEMPGTKDIQIRRLSVFAKRGQVGDPILTSDELSFEVEFYNHLDGEIIDVTWDLTNDKGVHVAHLGRVCDLNGLSTGWHRTTAVFAGNILNTGRYIFSVQFGRNQSELLFREEDVLVFEVDDDISDRGTNFGKLPGVIHPVCEWKTIAL